MKSPLLLWSKLAAELGGELGVDTSRDVLTVASRVKHEGEEFLTLALPSFRKAFERALDQGTWSSQLLVGFRHHRGLPQFLGGFLELVFDRDTGTILEDANPDAVRFIRQLTGMFGSILPMEGDESMVAGCTQERVYAALEHYLETDSDVAVSDSLLTEERLSVFRKTLESVFGRILHQLDYLVYSGGLLPRHSGGATADRLKGNQKWTFPEWTERLEEVFPFLDNTLPSHSLVSHRLDSDAEGLSVRFRAPDEEIPVRVIPVPKTCAKPRIISIEPSYMQYMQQAVGRWLQDAFESDSAISSMIRLNDRTYNQEAARIGSLDGSLATLDLSDASDRLSWRLVREGFSMYPWLVRAMDATRSRTADVAGVQHTLHKFASMGSALTFPIQTIVFTTIAWIGVSESRGLSCGLARRAAAGQVRVFGDDIVVPAKDADHVVAALESYGFKLNVAKSFWTGRFRESCGGDYFKGHDVSYVKVRRQLPSRRNEVEALVSAVELRNRFYRYGFWRTAKWMDEWLQTLMGLYPAISETSSLLGHLTYLQPDEGHRIDEKLQVPVATGLCVKEKLPRNAIDGVDALTRWFFEAPQEFSPLDHLAPRSSDTERFNRSGRPTNATLVRRTRPI